MYNPIIIYTKPRRLKRVLGLVIIAIILILLAVNRFEIIIILTLTIIGLIGMEAGKTISKITISENAIEIVYSRFFNKKNLSMEKKDIQMKQERSVNFRGGEENEILIYDKKKNDKPIINISNKIMDKKDFQILQSQFGL